MDLGGPVATVPATQIDSTDQVGWPGGLNLNGGQNIAPTEIVDSKDVEPDVNGFYSPRRTLQPFLPDTVETTYQKAPMTVNGQTYYFTLDNGKARYAKVGDTTWTDCTAASGSTNSFTTNGVGKPKFLRVLDHVLILNGKNGDRMASIDLTTSGFPVIKYVAVSDPTTTMTTTLTGITGSGAFKIYYAYTYSGNFGETKLSPIITQTISNVRDQWVTMSTPGKITLTFGDTPPTGAKYRNIYVALAASAGSIQASDMLQLAVQLDLSATSFVDDGTLDINLGNPAPLENNTASPKVSDGTLEDGNPILFGDPDNTEAIYIGGGGPYALSFSTANNGYKAEPEKGTNFTPTVIIGFRNGQGLPSLTVLYSNTEGLSKQAVLEQQTVTYGNTSFTGWGVTEQHYGAAGVAATQSAINYNGKLLFMSTDGLMSMNTQPLRQNVISTDNISIKKIDPLIRAIKNSAMDGIVGAGWDNRFMWTVPTDGFDTPQKILISDDNLNGAFYTLDIQAQWIGVVSPLDDAAFVYICQGKSTYKLLPSNSSFDVKGGVPVPFSTKIVGSLASVVAGNGAHNRWQASVQIMFYLLSVVGKVTIGVTYRNQANKLKTKTKVIQGADYHPTPAGTWGDPEWAWTADGPAWTESPTMTAGISLSSSDFRKAIPTGELIVEGQWFVLTEADYNWYKLRSVSFEGENVGVIGDLQ